MGNLGWTEMFFIAVIALIVFGPRRLPEMGKKLGRVMAQLRQASDQFKNAWENEVEKDGGLQDLRKLKDDLNPIKKLKDDLNPMNMLTKSSSSSSNNEPIENTLQTTNVLESSTQTESSNMTSIETSNISNNEINPEIFTPPIGVVERTKPISTIANNLAPVATVDPPSQVEENQQSISLTK
ncbi:MAG: twin-arginine translocase TatA/TatE family subunit [Blastocatellia bacterium]|nr:twin-arginine translocase TatA/TatE family subunit [Blastocatellia bacterium]MBN8724126.1 twin-arginine translocase TatA/TatE family subunit [Acidobacteriota bacterium]